MIEYKFDTQLLIEGNGLSEDEINAYITANIEGDCLLAVGNEELVKIHFHTNTPWKVLEYCASLGDIHDIVVENMERQANGHSGIIQNLCQMKIYFTWEARFKQASLFIYFVNCAFLRYITDSCMAKDVDISLFCQYHLT